MLSKVFSLGKVRTKFLQINSVIRGKLIEIPVYCTIILNARNGGVFMENLPNCPECSSEYTYEDGNLIVCPECGYEWSEEEAAIKEEEAAIKDANGNVLTDGDTVTVIKDLKLKGSSTVVKVGTKVKNIRLIDGDHNIDCKIDGIGPIQLKSEFVKKA